MHSPLNLPESQQVRRKWCIPHFARITASAQVVYFPLCLRGAEVAPCILRFGPEFGQSVTMYNRHRDHRHSSVMHSCSQYMYTANS